MKGRGPARRHRRLIGATLAVAVALAVGSCGGAAHDPPAASGSPAHDSPAASGSPALFNRETYAYASRLRYRGEAQRYRFIVLEETAGWRVALLHRANPHLKILLYQDPLVAKGHTTFTTCTSYVHDAAAEPGWFLTDSRGKRIVVGPDNYLMDVGQRAYQRVCLAHAVALAKRFGFDGLFFDGVAPALADAGISTAGLPPRYPTVPSWQTAMYSLLSYADAVAHRHGLLVIGNIGGAVGTPGLWQHWNTKLDGAEEEAWTDGGLGLAQQVPYWAEKLANVAWSEAHGKYAFVHSYNGTRAGNVYGLASMLLVAGGQSSYSTSNTNVIRDERWYPEYGTAQALGAPTGSYEQLANGVYKRTFAHGIVVVNPRERPASRFSLGPGTYSAPGLARARSASMGPTSGLILLRGR
jgi:Hypothetical glycosyl hydrolase family 15